MTTARDIAITRTYGAAHADLRLRLGRAAGTAWDRLGSYDEADIETYAAAMAAATDVTRRKGALLAAGYLSHFTGTRALPPELPALALEVWRPPFMTTWGALKRGEPYLAAVRAGHGRAMSTAGELVTSAVRESSISIDEAEPRIVGWNRVPSGACCQWCADMADIEWGSASAASLGDQHANCGCDLVPITAESSPGRDLTASLADAPADAAYVTPSGDAADGPT